MSKFFPSDLKELAKHLLTNGPRKTNSTSRRVRVLFNNSYIIDTTQALHVWEHDGFPQYYIPFSALQNCTPSVREDIKANGGGAGASILKIQVPGPKGFKEKTTDRAIRFSDDASLAGKLAGLVRLEFGSMDKWLEEDTPIYVHPKDPFRRIDVLPSTRPVEVKVGGKTVASSPNSVHLLETGLPTRFYLPLSAVDQSVLRPSDLLTKCPYKGDAEYYSVEVDGQLYRDLVWYYRVPTHESLGVAGLVCFYNEKVDIWLDGVQLERPKTHFG
ncbi:DUF427-domain-containing protein [Tothia fuscella]|uniref:DUF427-domain-containing protein n=1 Tax=Tothia fuscella TaxID=1048955 RepID=A0A9P4NKI4_9PEZI|nr:DUF427-domain-containing protein [Tothia fuscella]